MSVDKSRKPVELVPFQKENVATNQQAIPVPYLAGERLIAVRWLTPTMGLVSKQADTQGKKS